PSVKFGKTSHVLRGGCVPRAGPHTSDGVTPPKSDVWAAIHREWFSAWAHALQRRMDATWVRRWCRRNTFSRRSPWRRRLESSEQLTASGLPPPPLPEFDYTHLGPSGADFVADPAARPHPALRQPHEPALFHRARGR